MDESVYKFYQKENNPEYHKKYDFEHSPRLDFTTQRFKLDEIKNQKVGDFGCGAGFLLRRLDNSNQKFGFDGAALQTQDLLCNFIYHHLDLNQDWSSLKGFDFDVSFCMEVLEHIACPYYAVKTIKALTKPDAPIYITIPDEATWHNVVYPALMFPHTNFEEFLGQMALPIEDHVFFDGDWKHHIWKCRNASWREKKLKYPKDEGKFLDAEPLVCTNL